MGRPDRVLTDSSFLFALFTERDQHHAAALRLVEWLDIAQPILAWPILYETVNTRLMHRPATLARFESIANSPATVLLNDVPYRAALLAGVLAQRGDSGLLSLVDAVLCKIIEDVNVPVSALLTFNTRDFQQVCLRHDVALLDAD